MKLDINRILARLSMLHHTDQLEPVDETTEVSRVDRFKVGIQARRRRNKFIRHQRDAARRMNKDRGQLVKS